MSNNRLTFPGLAELRAELRALPAALAAEAAHIVEGRANGAGATIKGGYPSRAGELRDKLEVEHTRNPFGARSVVRNTSKHALPFEYGTQARHTKIGANRGSMPANPLFTQTVRRERRAMYSDLQAMVVRHGLTVTGDV
jgi:hypothetical protein